MFLRILGAVLVSGWLLGCTSPGALPPLTDGGAPTYTLEVLGTSGFGLAYGEKRDFWVMVRDEDGAPARGISVMFLVDGTAQDSGLAAVRASTGENGIAGTTILAGYTNAVFRIRATADNANPVSRYVSVAVAGFGTVSVTARYPGTRPLDGFDVGVYIEATCDSLRVSEGDEPDRAALLEAGVYEASFDELPASSTYAVVVDARAPSGNVIGRGCVDGITLARDETKSFMLDALDLPYDAIGSYDSALTVTLGDYAETLAGAAADGGSGAIESAGGESALMLDALDAFLESAGSDYAETLDALRAGRASDSVDLSLQYQLDGSTDRPSAAVARAHDSVLAYAATLRISGQLTIGSPALDDGRLGYITTGLALGPTDASLYEIDLDATGISAPWSLSGTFDALDAAVAPTTFDIELSSEEIGRAALEAAALAAEAPSVHAFLNEAFGCPEVGSNAAVLALVGEACGTECIVSACEAALGPMIDAITAGFADEASAYDGLHLTGSLTLRDQDQDLVADGFEAALDYALVGPADASLPLTGTFEGTRPASIAP
jgi:hypothetical protein